MENTQVGPFMVIRKVGSHRRHNVYHARQTKQNRDVALKFITLPRNVDREAALAKINHEVQVIKRIDHENIVKLYGAGTHEEKVFFAHELIDGESLYALLSRLGRLAPDLVIEYGTQLAEALEYLHQDDLVHSNLLTDKIIVTPEGRVMLADVRLNRPRKRRWDAPKRATLESAAYMAPEQLLGEGSTTKSDLYSLGVLLYEMVTGKLPFNPQTMGQLARDKQSNKVSKVTEHIMNCPAWLDKLIMKMIRADPKQRPHSARAVILTLEQIRSVDQSKQSVAVEMTRGFSALTAGKDKTEAHRLLGKKQEKEKKEAGPLLQSLPFLAGGLFMIFCIIALVTFWPFSATRVDMMSQADMLMMSNNPDDWREARKLHQKIMKSSDEALAAEAQKKYYLSRRKSMLHRLDQGVSGLNKPEILKFNRGYLLQKQRRPDEALAFFQHFVDDYDRENDLVYVYDEAKERLDQLLADKVESTEKLEEIQDRLNEADQLAKSADTLNQAHVIWDEILNDFLDNDFLQLHVQRAETGKLTSPLAAEELPPETNAETNEEATPEKVIDSQDDEPATDGGGEDSGQD